MANRPDLDNLREKYPNNSLSKQKEVEKDTSPVVKHKVSVKKKTFLEKAESKIFQTSLKNAAGDIFNDILVPAAKVTFFDMCSGFLRSILFGGGSYIPSNRSSLNQFGTSHYGSYYKRQDQPRTNAISGSRISLESIVFETYQDAEMVFNRMLDFLETYHRVSVSDYYEITGYGTPAFTYNNYGWTNLSTVKIVKNGSGWGLSLPPLEVI